MATLAELSWPSVPRSALLVVPLGSTEQHGPHLPLGTDTDIATELCRRLAELREDVLLAPAVPYGSAGEHAGFPGTLSIGQRAIELLVVELVRSATDTFDRVLLVCGHGGNAEPVTEAVRSLRAESRDVRLFLPQDYRDPHAGHEETAMQLAMRPELVDMAEAKPGHRRPVAELMGELRTGGVRAVSESGVLGDPSHAEAESGVALLDAFAEQLRARAARWFPEARA